MAENRLLLVTLITLACMFILITAQNDNSDFKDKEQQQSQKHGKHPGGRLGRLTREEYTQMRKAFKPLLADNRELLPRLVQLAFHDCVGGCDGCLNLQDPNNFNLATTLALAQRFRADHAPMLSQADVNVFISIRALAFAARQAYGRLRVPFSVGRQDCANPESPPLRTFPHGRGLDSVEFLSREFGTSKRQSVALLGVHTLGRCNAGVSGYRGPWDESQDKLDNKYFQNMVEPGWFVEQRDELPIVQSSQWSKNDADESMMLHADMIMFKNFTTSGQFDTPSCEFDECPLSDTAHHVAEFANSQRKFHRTLREAFRKMVDGAGDNNLQLVEDDGDDEDIRE